LDFFQEKPERVYAMRQGSYGVPPTGMTAGGYTPTRLVDYYSVSRLSKCSLGGLFANGEIGW
jgi:hypothetical protein